MDDFQSVRQEAISLHSRCAAGFLNSNLSYEPPPYFFPAASAADFKSASPFSNWLPIILSQSMKSPTALAMKLFLPDMLHITTVWLPSGLKVNSAVLVPLKGFRNSSL